MGLAIGKVKVSGLSKALGWNLAHWAVFGVILLVAVTEVYERQVERLATANNKQIDVIEDNITQYNTMAERLATLEVLPPVKEQWDYVVAIANKYGVKMTYRSGSTKYEGPLEAWGGSVTGNTGPVLVVAKELQETVPTYLYDFNINAGKASFEFAVLGSE